MKRAQCKYEEHSKILKRGFWFCSCDPPAAYNHQSSRPVNRADCSLCVHFDPIKPEVKR